MHNMFKQEKRGGRETPASGGRRTRRSSRVLQLGRNIFATSIVLLHQDAAAAPSNTGNAGCPCISPVMDPWKDTTGGTTVKFIYLLQVSWFLDYNCNRILLNVEDVHPWIKLVKQKLLYVGASMIVSSKYEVEWFFVWWWKWSLQQVRARAGLKDYWYSVTYGSTHCDKWDNDVPPTCALQSGTAIADRPDWYNTNTSL